MPAWASVTTSGNVVLQRRLDFEALESHKDADGNPAVALSIEAVSDDQRRTSTATIHVTILDVNDHSPQFAENVSN